MFYWNVNLINKQTENNCNQQNLQGQFLLFGEKKNYPLRCVARVILYISESHFHLPKTYLAIVDYFKAVGGLSSS